MDTVTLVDKQFRGGERLLDRLAQEGIRVIVAGWVKPADEDRWSLYVATPLVNEKGQIQAYREVYHVLRSLEDVRVKDYEVKLVGEGHRIAGDLLEVQPHHHARAPQWSGLTSVGGIPVEEVYVYPPARPKTTGPRHSVLRFVLRSTENPIHILSRLNPHGEMALNRTEWRGKEPRSCGIIAVKGRPHSADSTEPFVFDVEVAYRPKGCITYSGGTKFDGWTAMVLDRAHDGILLDGHGKPLPDGHPPVYRRVEVFKDVDYNEIDFGEFVGEFEVEGVRHVSFEHVMKQIQDSGRFGASIESTFIAPRRHRPRVKIVISSDPTGTERDGFGTMIFNVNKSTPQLQQVLLETVTELVNGVVEGRYSVKNMSNDEFVFAELDDILVDCTPNDEGKESRFNCLSEYLTESYLDELAMQLTATYEVDVSVVDGPKIGLLLRRADRSRKVGPASERLVGIHGLGGIAANLGEHGPSRGKAQLIQGSKSKAQEVSISFQFTVPSDDVLEAAKQMAASSNKDEELVGKAVIDLTEITKRTIAAIKNTASKENYDLAVYFDYNFGESLEAARRLNSSTESSVRHVAETLIEQAEAIASSKAAFQAAAKKAK